MEEVLPTFIKLVDVIITVVKLEVCHVNENMTADPTGGVV